MNTAFLRLNLLHTAIVIQARRVEKQTVRSLGNFRKRHLRLSRTLGFGLTAGLVRAQHRAGTRIGPHLIERPGGRCVGAGFGLVLPCQAVRPFAPGYVAVGGRIHRVQRTILFAVFTSVWLLVPSATVTGSVPLALSLASRRWGLFSVSLGFWLVDLWKYFFFLFLFQHSLFLSFIYEFQQTNSPDRSINNDCAKVDAIFSMGVLFHEKFDSAIILLVLVLCFSISSTSTVKSIRKVVPKTIVGSRKKKFQPKKLSIRWKLQNSWQ